MSARAAPTVAVVALLSFRLGGIDGVSVVAGTWARILRAAGHTVVTIAGDGPVDRTVPGLGWPAGGGGGAPPHDPSPDAVRSALADVDLVVVENLCSLPLHPRATQVVAGVLRGRPAILHHYDLPWQRARFGDVAGWPPVDPAWAHVTINELSRAELAARGVEAVTIRCGIDVHVLPGAREATRAAVGFDDDERVLLHPVRALERKDVPAAVQLAEALGATYWLTGPAEEGYGPTLAGVLAEARCKVVHRPVAAIADAYAACDAVALPSTWEGFGNPVAEAALHRRPIAVGGYPVAQELSALGFRWFAPERPEELAAFLEQPDPALHDANEAVLRQHLSLERVTEDLLGLIASRWPG